MRDNMSKMKDNLNPCQVFVPRYIVCFYNDTYCRPTIVAFIEFLRTTIAGFGQSVHQIG